MASNTKILDNIIRSMKKEDHDPLTPLIDRYFIEREKPENRHLLLASHTMDTKPRLRPLGRLSPSGLCGCERQAVFKFAGVAGKKRIDPDVQGIFDDGHWRHHKWQFRAIEMEAILGKNNFRVYGIEQSVKMSKLYVAGSLDLIVGIRYRGSMEKWVIDIKGINSFGFQSVFQEQKPKPEHVEQLIAYMRAKKVQRGILLYEDKNTNHYQCFVVIFNDEQWQEVRRWCRKTVGYMERREVPPMHPECKNGTFLYEKCIYKGICFGSKTKAQIERMTYSEFPGVKALWKKGFEIEAEDA